MRIGEKVRRLRLSKLMTQSDLAGDLITRNMLCRIERGTALPSLPTALYLAERLGVPVGYLLAEDDDEFAYRKMTNVGNLRRAFADGDFEGCLAMIKAVFGDENDDEIALMRAECEFGLAREAFDAGRLRVAAAAFDRALTAASHTLYTTAWLESRAAVYFRYLGGISPTLVSDVLDADTVAAATAEGDDFCEYSAALAALDAGRTADVERYLAAHAGTLYAARVSALLRMRREEYAAALAEYEKLLAREDLPVGVLMYEIFRDMDFCCRRNDDYKRAYEFAGSGQGLLERLLEEV